MLSTMKRSSMIILLFILIMFLVPTQFLVVKSDEREFDFFYFVQHWPGSECNTKKGCCYPTTGKPLAVEFGIHGLWPEYNDGKYPTNCDPKRPYDSSKIKDLIPALQKNWPSLTCPSGNGSKFWAHEWKKHGTCSSFNQHEYFNAALKLKAKMNLLQMLAAKKIKPDGKFYNLGDIMDSISNRTGFTPGIQCNEDKSKKLQLYQVIVCVDKSSEFIYCPPRAQPGTKSCHIKGNKGIHGLWPEYIDGLEEFPEFCDKHKKKIPGSMNPHWPPSEDGSTVQSTSQFGKPLAKKKAGTWEHEWDKHGTCSLLDQHGYFNAALQLKARNNLRQILVNAGIRPVDGSSYSSEQVVDALAGTIGVAPRIECNAKSQLYQVYLCVDKSSDLNFIECPRANQMTINCRTPKAIEFPSFPSDLQLRDEP